MKLNQSLLIDLSDQSSVFTNSASTTTFQPNSTDIKCVGECDQPSIIL